MIDYILKNTGQKKLFYLGHSQGTTAFFVMSSELPYHQEKIEAMFAMAPVAYCGRIKSPVLQVLARVADAIDVSNSSLYRKKIMIVIDFEYLMDRFVVDADEINRSIRIRAYRWRDGNISKMGLRGGRHHATLLLEHTVPDRRIRQWTV